jgi:hypothetical protein
VTMTASETAPVPGRYVWDGDHVAIDQWAELIVAELTGRTPDMGPITGDCYGVYIEPERLRALGIPTDYTGTVGPARIGDSVVFTGKTFVIENVEASRAMAEDSPNRAPVPPGGHRPAGASSVFVYTVPENGLDPLHLRAIIDDLHGVVCSGAPGDTIASIQYGAGSSQLRIEFR